MKLISLEKGLLLGNENNLRVKMSALAWTTSPCAISGGRCYC